MQENSSLRTFNELFTVYQRKFIRFANCYVHDSALAEDFTITSFMNYWENSHLLPPDHNAPAYILTCIKNKCLNHLKHLDTKAKINDELSTHAQWELSTRIATLKACEPYELFSTEIKEIVDKTLLKLPETTRKIFIMSRYHGCTNREIAQEMDMTTKGVEFHISKAIKLFRINLKDYMPFFIFFYSVL